MSILASSLAGFEVASPELLAERMLLRRVDTKFAMSRSQLPRMLASLRDDYAVLPAGDTLIAEYQTLYFDSVDLHAFVEHCRGRRPRHKVRIRSYPDRAQSFLEVKRKTSADRTVKWRCAREYQQIELSDEDRGFVAQHYAAASKGLQHTLWTNFRRVTLLGLHRNERVTVDLDLCFRRQGQEVSMEDAVILEVKQHRFQARSPVMLALRAEGVRPLSISKYCAAATLLFPKLRGQRYLPRLRAFRKARDA